MVVASQQSHRVTSLFQTSSHPSISYSLLLFTLIMIFQIFTQTNSQLAASTVYSGVTYNYNKYLHFGGSSGLMVNESISNLTTYSMSIWFRLDQAPWGDLNSDMSIVQFSSAAFQIIAARQGNIQYRSDKGSTSTINGDIRVGQWYIAMISTSANSAQLSLKSMADSLIGSATSSVFFPTGYKTLAFTSIYIGIKSDSISSAFYGNIRNLRLFQNVYTDSQMWNMQFIKVYPTLDLRLQILMNDAGDYINEAGLGQGTIVGSTKSLPLEDDYMGVVWCWNPTLVFPDFLDLTPSTLQFNTYSLTSNYNTGSVVSGTVQMWIQRDYGVSPQDETLFLHQNMISLAFKSNNYDYLIFTGRQQTAQSITQQVRYNLWYYIQAQTSDKVFQLFIADYNGNTLYNSGQVSYSSTNLGGTTTSVTISNNFQGYIKGIKYYKTFDSSVSATSMSFALDSDSNLVFYFLLQAIGYDSSSNEMTNLALQNFNNGLSIASNAEASFVSRFWIDMNSQTSFEGTVNAALTFDNYTCINNKTRLQMTSASSYANTLISLTSQDSSYTVELWVRVQKTTSGSVAIVSLADYKSQSTIYFTIRQESTNLYCYPYYINSEKMQYTDYVTNPGVWVHISCVYNGDSKVISGTYYRYLNDYSYTMNSQQQESKLPVKQYLFQINAAPGSGSASYSGFSSSFYSDVRFWNIARDLQDIKYQRFNQLDLTASQSLLYSYMKLLNGGFSYSSEIDFSDSSLQRQVTFSNTQWTVNTELLICPLGYFHFDSNQNTCYRDGVQGVSLVVYKSGTNYTVMAQNLTFKNQYLTAYPSQIYNIGWALVDVSTKGNTTDASNFKTQFAPQSSNMNLVFTYSQVANNPGVYDLSFDVNDINQYQSKFSQAITLTTLNCLSLLVDNQPEDSLVFVDISTQMSQVDAQISISTTSCLTYVFDSTQLVFQYINNTQMPALRSPTYSSKFSSIVISAKDHQYMTLGAYQYVNVSYAFKNTKSNLNSITYLKLIAFRFIPGLTVVIGQNLNKLISGQALVITSAGTILTNNFNNYQINLQWVCPGQLAVYCSSQAGQSTLTISYNTFQNSGLNPFTSYQISLVASIVIPDFNLFQSIQQTISALWIPFNVTASILGPQNPVSTMANVYQINIHNAFTDSEINIKWSISPSINQSLYINSNNRKQFVIGKSALQNGIQYNISVQVFYASNLWSLYNGSYLVQASVPPSGGSVTISPSSGIAYQTQFNISVKSWKSSNTPMKYQYCYINSNGAIVPLTSKTTDTVFTTTLPVISSIAIYVFDSYSSSTLYNMSVNITTAASDNLQNLVNQINTNQNKFTQTMISQAVVVTSSIPTLINAFNYTITQTMMNQVTNNILYQSNNLKSFPTSDLQQFFLRSSIESFQQMSNNSNQIFNVSQASSMQQAILNLLQYQQTQMTSLMNFSNFTTNSYSSTIFGAFQQDDNFNTNFLKTQSNILQSTNTLYTSGLITSLNSQDGESLGLVSDQLRQILAAYETITNTMAYEGYAMNYDLDYMFFQVSKFSRMANSLMDIDKSIVSPQINTTTTPSSMQLYFPLSAAQQPTERQGLSMIAYKSNPFLGSYYLNQTTRSNQSVYFAYRDTNGTYLGSGYINSNINMSFPYAYDDYSFLPNITVCAYIGNSDSNWGNQSCSTVFDRSNKLVHCSCQHMSTYAVIENFLKRPLVTPLIYLQFQNWPSFAVFLYMFCIFIFGVIYTYNKDYQDFRFLHEQENNAGGPLHSEDSLTLNSLAFKRQVFFMAFASEFKFTILYKLFIMKLHPLLQLKYKLDPQIPRFYKFLVIYTRLMIIMGVSFLYLRDHPNLDEISGDSDFASKVMILVGYIVVGSIILVPIPILFLCCFKSKYFIRQEKDDENDLKKTSKNQSKVYIDPSIPIRLLFLINTVPISDLQKNYDTKIPYASGASQSLGKKLTELEDDPNTMVGLDYESESSNRDLNSERVSDRASNRAAAPQINIKQTHNSVPSQARHDMVQPNQYRTHIQGQVNPGIVYDRSISSDQINEDEEDQEEKYSEHYSHSQFAGVNKTESKMIEPSGIILEMNEEENIIDDDSEYKEGGESSPSHHQKQGEITGSTNHNNLHNQRSEDIEFEEEKNNNNRQPAGGQEADRQESASGTSVSDTTMNTQDFLYNKKELYQQKNFFGRLFGVLLAIGINGLIIYYVAYLYMHEQYYNAGSRYVWVAVFFLAQIIGFFITDFLALLIMATSVACCCRKKKTFLAYTMRESLVIYEDYKFVFKLLHTNLN